MRIAHVTWVMSALGGGIPPVIAALGRAQRIQGVEVGVFGVQDPASPPIVGEQPFTLSKLRGPRAFGYAPTLTSQLHAAAPEVVHLHGLFTWPSRAAERFGRATNTPVIVAPHGMLEPWALANSRWKKRAFLAAIERRNLNAARCLHALNEQEAESFRAFGLRQPIAVIPNGVEPDAASLASRPSAVAGVPVEGRRWLLFLGRLHPKKGLPLLVEAFRALRTEALGEWGVLIAGPDQSGHRADVEAAVRSAQLGDVIKFVGPLHGEEKEQAFRAADAFILPSYSEGFPVAVLEAMTRKLPVFITTECHLDEVATLGAGAVEEPTVDGVKSLLRTCAAMAPAQLCAMGARGKAFVDAAYSWQQVAQQSVAVYRWLCGSGPRPDCVRTT